MQKNNNKLLSCETIEPENTANKSIIWLHGLGADSHDFVPIVPELMLPDKLNIRFIFPSAPIIPVTINNGYKMRAWFDIYNATISSKIDEAGIKQSVQQINDLIQNEINKGIEPKNIVLAGFSQGAVIALLTALSHPIPLAGVIALSGYLPHTDGLSNKQTPIFMAHGTEDTVVDFAQGKQTYEMMSAEGFNIEWHEYPMPHSVCAEEIADLRKWLLKRW